MFWQAAPSAEHPDGYESSAFAAPLMPPPAESVDGLPPRAIRVAYSVSPSAVRVRMRVLIQPVGREVLDM